MSRHRDRISSADLLCVATFLKGASANVEDEDLETSILGVAAWLRGTIAEREEVAACRALVKAHGLTMAQARTVYLYELEGIKNR